ncbi:hypothetical protein [Luteimonas deserti]|uniref:Type II secretion system protein n=1 Tax=Luteimonas deserti TaxID=2752306 RepID=A0A7Z0QNR4_9GAMM|nr:hypothetical protein [Luteimonas deserti]NYZ61231.1 hypothetical protein [Luteimonas deserti]
MTVSGYGRGLLIAGGLVSLLAVGAALVLIGSPASQREARLDAARVRDLVAIERRVNAHAQREHALPASLSALDPGGRIVDPASGATYGYTVIDARRFRLCARFATDSRDALRQAEPWIQQEWQHGVGETCFDRTLERDLPAGATARP